MIGLHFYVTPTRQTDLFIVPLALIGWAIDASLTITGWYEFQAAPVWLATVWVGFVLCLHHSLVFIARLPVFLQALLGGISGPLAYFGGYKLEAVNWPNGVLLTLLLLSLIWSVLLPVLIRLDTKIRQPHEHSSDPMGSGETPSS